MNLVFQTFPFFLLQCRLLLDCCSGQVFGARQYFFTKNRFSFVPFPTGLGLGAADRKIRDLHVRGFCHSSEYISNGSESEKESKKMGFKLGGFIF